MTIFSRSWLVPVLLLLQPTPISMPAAHAAEAVTMQLKWLHAFQFAGYYAAKEQGYYAQADLDVTIREGFPGVDVVDEVVSGRAAFSVGTSALLLARKAGKPVVVLAVIYQHSPQVLIAVKHGPAQSVSDLIGKRLMIEAGSDELLAYLQRLGIGRERFQLQAHSFNLRDLIDGKTDAVSAYQTSEPYFLDQAGVEYQIYTPRSDGIDFYGDNLFTSEQELKQHPARVKAFREATLRGWAYAMDHPDAMIDLIVGKYGRAEESGKYRHEATQMASLIHADVIDIGTVNPGRWRHIADTYAEIGMLPANYSFGGFLYDPNPQVDLRWVYTVLAASIALTTLVGAIAFYVLRINRRLAQTITERKHLQELQDEDLRFARDLQISTLPPPKIFEGKGFALEAVAQMEALKEVGGDFYDFALLDEDRVYFAVGDASGKGVPAAMFATMCRTNLHSVSQHGDEPAEILTKVNAYLSAHNPTLMFVTAVIGILDLRTGLLTYASAGHPFSLHARSDREPLLLEAAQGMALGVDETTEYTQAVCQLAAGDTLVLYSDGISEAENPDGELFGEQRLSDLVGRLGLLSAPAVVDGVFHAVAAFARERPFGDDITLLILRVAAKSAAQSH